MGKHSIQIPSPFHDQTLTSWIQLIMYNNCWLTARYTSKILFNSQIENTRTFFHSGYSELSKQLSGTPYENVEYLQNKVCYRILFKPFISNRYFQEIFFPKYKNQSTGYRKAIDALLKVSVNFCFECVAEEIEKYGIAYEHRTHQIMGVYYCDRHYIPLHQINSQHTGRESTISLLHSSEIRSLKRNSTVVTHVPNSIWHVRYAHFTNATLSNNIPILSKVDRAALYAKRINVNFSSLESVESGFNELFKDIKSRFFNSQFSNNESMFRWRFFHDIFLCEANTTHSALSNIYVMSMLFSDKEDYLSLVSKITDTEKRAIRNILPFESGDLGIV